MLSITDGGASREGLSFERDDARARAQFGAKVLVT